MYPIFVLEILVLFVTNIHNVTDKNVLSAVLFSNGSQSRMLFDTSIGSRYPFFLTHVLYYVVCLYGSFQDLLLLSRKR
uniref:Uncharacterized protein n=1 Tax=Rhizophora mucronata TaxID=61149 RepID=A0A2P2NIW9_RHIMU